MKNVRAVSINGVVSDIRNGIARKQIVYIRTMASCSSAPIHNYCDRWCERCFLTSKCPIYDKALGVNDQDNESFWNTIGSHLEQAMQLLLTEVRTRGIDIDAIPIDHEAREQIKLQNRHHPAAKLSLQYSNNAFDWRHERHNKIDQEEPIMENPSKKNCLEVIGWYEIFIHAKIMRALSGKYTEEFWPADDGPKDHDGSAKIALIAIERSAKAWSTLLKFIPEQATEIINIIAMLEQLQRLVEHEFPEAWSFIRPGFDEG